ncbi:MAG: OmpA family protein [Oligoflexia bacterium]|nr:OmpA family protein [Oligoflexia bacterium]
MSDEPRKKKEEQKAGAPAWMVTFSDMTTLLLTFFVLLLSFANTDLIKYKEALGSLKDAFGVQTLEIGNFQAQSPSPISLEAPTPKPFAIIEHEVSGGRRADTQEDVREGEAVEEGLDKETKEMLEDIRKLIMDEGLLDEVGVDVEQGKIHIRARANVLFDSGSVKIKRESYSLLKKIAFLMKKTRYNLTIEGHTDSDSVSGSFPSNWELSSVRATTVLRFINLAGVDKVRLRPIGYGDSRPLVPNTSARNKVLNRRVEFVFTKEMWE